MILYNVTVSIDPAIADEWLSWMRQQHIPDVMSTGCFLESRISRVHGEEEGGITYAVSYVSPNQATMDIYQNEYSPRLQAEHTTRYQGRFAAFRTFLQIIEEFKQT
jgi:hypothetical protein